MMDFEPTETPTPVGYSFSDFKLQLRPFSLARDGRPISLQPQPARLLELLVARPGKVLTREIIREHLWPEDSFLDHEQAINFAVRKIRVALGDRAGEPRFVETVPRRGYRFIAEVTPVLDSGTAGTAVEEAHSESLEHPSPQAPSATSGPWLDLSKERLGQWRPMALMGLLALIVAPLGTSTETLAPSRTERAQSPTALRSESPSEPELPKRTDPIDTEAVDEASLPESLRTDYIQGRYWVEKGSDENIRKGIAKLRRVVELAPSFAPAHYALGRGFLNLIGPDAHFSAYMPQVSELADRAVRLDGSIAESRLLRAVALFFYERRWREAEDAARKALELQPDYPEAKHMLGVMVAADGRFDEGLRLIRQSVEADPAKVAARSDVGWGLMWARRFGDALEAIDLTLELAPDNKNLLFFKGSLHTRLGERGPAFQAFSDFLTAQGADQPETLEQAFDRIRQRLEERRRDGKRSHFSLALIHSLSNRPEKALDLLLESCEHDPDWELPFVGVDPRFDGLRTLPRYELLAGCMPNVSV